MLIGQIIRDAVEAEIQPYETSRLAVFVRESGPYAIKFVASKWASHYAVPQPLKISANPALTWGTATYVTPLSFPLSSVLYGRIGLVTEFNPSGWRIFDATRPSARMAYIKWVRAQPAFPDLVLTVHSTHANHFLRNQFRQQFNIDCVLFNPDQEAEIHTDRGKHVWMAVTDWAAGNAIETQFSSRLSKARFTVLIDEDFSLEENGLPIQKAARQIEQVTQNITTHACVEVGIARTNPNLNSDILQQFQSGGYLHVFIKP